jgi:pimeloyl-ACP methyl ester carboxylesterase
VPARPVAERPKLLLVPEFTELEWTIKPLLEKWAEVISFDLPGVGDEPPAERLDREAVVERALEKLDQRGWESFFVAGDSWGTASAVQIALTRPEAIKGLALGHAKLSYRREGERAPINAEVVAGLTALIDKDHEQFLRYGITQATGGSIDEDQAAKMVARFPRDMIRAGWDAMTRDDVDIGALLAQVECPLLFAKHEGCLGSTDEGFEDVAAAFPDARTIAVTDAPLASEEFAEALRGFCLETAPE